MGRREGQAVQECPQCHRLWGEYISALFHHASVDRQLYFTSLGAQRGPIDALSSALVSARIAKDGLRERIGQHMETHRKAVAATA